MFIMSVFIGIKIRKKIYCFFKFDYCFFSVDVFFKIRMWFFFFVIIFSEWNFWIIFRKEE